MRSRRTPRLSSSDSCRSPRAFSAFSSHRDEGTRSTPGAVLSRTTSMSCRLPTKASRKSLPPSSTPSQSEAAASGSMSMSRHLRPCSARAAERLTALVVFPEPPFWFMTATVRICLLHDSTVIAIYAITTTATRSNHENRVAIFARFNSAISWNIFTIVTTFCLPDRRRGP